MGYGIINGDVDIYVFGLQVRVIRNKFIIYRKTFARVDMLASTAIQNDSVCHISFVFCGRDQKCLAIVVLVVLIRSCLCASLLFNL